MGTLPTAVADGLSAEPGPGRGLSDQFYEDFVATVVAEHGSDGFGESGGEFRDDAGCVLSCEHFLAHARVTDGAADATAAPPRAHRPGGMPTSLTSTDPRAHSPYTDTTALVRCVMRLGSRPARSSSSA